MLSSRLSPDHHDPQFRQAVIQGTGAAIGTKAQRFDSEKPERIHPEPHHPGQLQVHPIGSHFDPQEESSMLLLKLDISKAFDTLSWPFLQARGFGPNWRRWISVLLSTASSKIMLNGHQGPTIQHRRGVRQGDSLSPMLFIIAMDVLHRLFLKAARDGVPRKIEPSAVKYQCSFYADDVILFIRPTAVKEILRIFGEASGLQTNLAKCSITPIFGGEDNLHELVTILGCQVEPFPIRYLGLPLSTKRLPKAHLQSMAEAVARKLPPSHGSLMARSGRLI